MKEARDLEFKVAVNNSFLKTVSAFANYGKGTILFDVDDRGNEAGVDNPKQACLDIEHKINDSISPMPDYSLEVNKRNNVITLVVEKGMDVPYLYKAKAYKRHDTSTVEVDTLELKRLILEGENLTYDQTPSQHPRGTYKTLEKKLCAALGINALTDDMLKTLELIRFDGTQTIAGELFSDDNGILGIDIARFGESIDVFLDRVRFEKESILEQYDKALEMFRTFYTYEEVKGAERVRKESIPEEAYREAIANALVHRQWDVRAAIRVAMHPDRIEIYSPGGLPKGLSEKDYLEGQVVVLRNPIVANVFFRLRLIESFGTGILRIKNAYRHSKKKPRFKIDENVIVVTLPLVDENAELSDDEARVIDVLRGRKASTSELSSDTGFGKTKLQKLLRGLEEGGYITISGRGRGTRYKA